VIGVVVITVTITDVIVIPSEFVPMLVNVEVTPAGELFGVIDVTKPDEGD